MRILSVQKIEKAIIRMSASYKSITRTPSLASHRNWKDKKEKFWLEMKWKVKSESLLCQIFSNIHLNWILFMFSILFVFNIPIMPKMLSACFSLQAQHLGSSNHVICINYISTCIPAYLQANFIEYVMSQTSPTIDWVLSHVCRLNGSWLHNHSLHIWILLFYRQYDCCVTTWIRWAINKRMASK